MIENGVTVSVIIPVQYRENYIRDCILSVCGQSYEKLEILLVTDDPAKVESEIGSEPETFDQRIRVIHFAGGGISGARGAGIRAASGKYLYFIDEGCHIAFNAIERGIRCAEKYCADIVATTKRDETNRYETVVGSGKEIYYELFRRDCHKADGKLINRSWFLSKRFSTEMGEIMPYIFLWAKRAVLIDEGLYYGISYIDHSQECIPKDIVENADHLLSYLKRRDRQVYWYTREYVARDLLTRFRGIRWNGKEKENQEFIQAYKMYLQKYRWDCLCLKSVGMKERLEIFLYSLGWMNPLLRKVYAAFKHAYKEIKLNKETRVLKRYSKYVLLIGTEYFGNLGDHHIALSEFQFLHTYFPDYRVIEIPFSDDITRKIRKYRSRVASDTVIFLAGGGNIGDEYESEQIRHAVMKAFPEQRKIVFPQTVYFKDLTGQSFIKAQKYYTENNNVTFFCRERYSKMFADQYFKCDTYLVPDMVFFKQYSFDTIREDVVFCMRQDKEKSIGNDVYEHLRKKLGCNGIQSRMMDTQYVHGIHPSDRFGVLETFLKKIASAQVVVTDRLHGMIFSYITGTPCLAISNYNDKVKGVYEWIKGCNYVKFMDRLDTEEDLRKAENIINDLLKLPLEERKTVSLKSEFDEMAKIISEILINVE